MQTYPLTTEIAKSMPLGPLLVIEPVARELYSVSDTVLDEAAAMRAFSDAYRRRTGYLPHPHERAEALHIFAQRAERRQDA